MYMKLGVIWAEMARRKVQFHNTMRWHMIRNWGLFNWNDVSRLINDGRLKTDMHKENHVIWVTPSEETWKTKIKPLIDKYSLDELTKMAGWY
jgi:hypothetical protein